MDHWKIQQYFFHFFLFLIVNFKWKDDEFHKYLEDFFVDIKFWF